MRNSWMILVALAMVGAAHAQADKAPEQSQIPGADPRRPAAKAAPKQAEYRGPRTGPAQAAGPVDKAAPAPEAKPLSK